MFKFISFFILFFANINNLKSDEINAFQLFKGCESYYYWVKKNYKIPVDEKVLFSMGKCQGVLETMGKTMLTLCYERKRNLNINKQLTANLKGIKTIEIVEKFIQTAAKESRLRKYTAHSYLIKFINKNWPCD